MPAAAAPALGQAYLRPLAPFRFCCSIIRAPGAPLTRPFSCLPQTACIAASLIPLFACFPRGPPPSNDTLFSFHLNPLPPPLLSLLSFFASRFLPASLSPTPSVNLHRRRKTRRQHTLRSGHHPLANTTQPAWSVPLPLSLLCSAHTKSYGFSRSTPQRSARRVVLSKAGVFWPQRPHAKGPKNRQHPSCRLNCRGCVLLPVRCSHIDLASGLQCQTSFGRGRTGEAPAWLLFCLVFAVFLSPALLPSLLYFATFCRPPLDPS